MRITMLQDAAASPDDEMNRYGYEAGQTYTTSNPLDYATHPLPISEALAARFMADGLAVDAEAESGEVSAPAVSPAVSPLVASLAASPVNEAAEAPTPTPEPESDPKQE